MSKHIAILNKKYIDLILSGKKTIESRITKYNLPPYKTIALNDTIYFKQSSGPFLAKAKIKNILFLDNLTHAKINNIHKKYNKQICATPDYWLTKKHARYATIIFLKNIQPHTKSIPFEKSYGKAWFTLD